jgi:hypothetical protein
LDIYGEIEKLNEGRDSRWFYSGDVNIGCGGIAVKVDRLFGYADVVEMVELSTATNDAAGLALLEKGTVILSRLGLIDRNHLRSAMQSLDLTMAGLLRDYPDRDERMAELARAKWIYGQADRDSTVIRFDPEAAAENDPDIWNVDDDVEGEEGLGEAFLDALD